MGKDDEGKAKVSRRDFLVGAAGAGFVGAGMAYAAGDEGKATTSSSQPPGKPVAKSEPQLREVGRAISTVRTKEGAGFPVRRPFPVQGLSHVDPFMLLDEMGPVDWPPGKAVGAPWHPHRGFETVTYLLEGAMEHEDSRGNVARLNPGGVQWMTAGAGIVHSELPEKKYKAKGGVMHGFQLWVNLPAAQKMIQPRYQDIPAEKLPTWTRPDGGVTVRVIAGEAQGMKAAAQTHTSITYLHVTVQPGAEHTLPLPKHEDISIFLFKNHQFYSDVPAITGGSSGHELKRFESWNLFLEDLKKFYIFIFRRVRYVYSTKETLLMLYILLTKMFTLC